MTAVSFAIGTLVFRSGRRAPRRGVSITELALFLPVLILLALGTIEACSMIYLKQALEVAAYEGARVALNPTATSENVQGQCLQMLTDRHIQNGTVEISPSDVRSAAVGQYIQVSVTAPCASNSLFGSMFYSHRTLNGTVEMMNEM